MKYRRSLLYGCIGVVLVLLFSCKQSEKTKSSSDSTASSTQELQNLQTQRIPERDSIQQKRLHDIAEYLRETYQKVPSVLIKEFGNPISVDTNRMKNVHSDEQDFIYSYSYRDKTIIIYHAISVGQYFLEFVELKNITGISKFGIASSMSIDSLKKVLGTETSSVDDPRSGYQLRYQLGDGTQEDLFFIFQRGRLKSVQFQPYLD